MKPNEVNPPGRLPVVAGHLVHLRRTTRCNWPEVVVGWLMQEMHLRRTTLCSWLVVVGLLCLLR